MQEYTEIKNGITSMLDADKFDSVDTMFAQGINKKENWTVPMATAAYKMLKKYRERLRRLGHDVDSIPAPKDKETVKRAIRPVQNSEQKTYMKAELRGGRIWLEFKAKSNTDEIKIQQLIKTLPGWQFEGNGKWSVTEIDYSIEKLNSIGFRLPVKEKEKIADNTKPIISEKAEELNLLPFQTEDYTRVEELNGRTLIAWEPGLGKSLITIKYLQNHINVRPVIIICPSAVKEGWRRYLKKYLPDEEVKVIQGRSCILTGKESIMVINYDVLKDYDTLLKEFKPQMLVFDESQRLNVLSNFWTRASFNISQDVNKIFCLSGTPIKGKTKQLFSTLHLLNPDMFPNQNRFYQRYCLNDTGDERTKYDGHRNLSELNEILISSFMVRRTKEEVLKDLPERRHIPIPLEINNRSEYRHAEQDIIDFIRSTEGNASAQRAMKAQVFIKLQKLQSLAVQGKIAQVVDWVKDFLDSDKKLLICCSHYFAFDSIHEEFKDVTVIADGRCSPKKKQQSIDTFIEDPNKKLFIVNYFSMGEGVDGLQTVCSDILIAEYVWSPHILDQIISRLHRYGAKEGTESINIYHTPAINTVEERMLTALDKKLKVMSAIFDGKEVKEDSILTEVIEEYKNF